MKLTKGKGHTTLKDLEDGKITVEQRKGNAFSDTAADAGSHQAMPGLLHLTKWMAARHKQYCKFMDRVHRFIIANLKMEKRLRAETHKRCTWDKNERQTNCKSHGQGAQHNQRYSGPF